MKPPATTSPAKIPTRLNRTWINVNVVRPKNTGASFQWERPPSLVANVGGI